MFRPVALLFLLVLPGGSDIAPASAQSEDHWPSFRGEHARGVAEGVETPVSWDIGDAADVTWSTPLPGLGLSSPVVWGDRVFVTTAISQGGDESFKPGLYGDIAPVQDDSEHEYRVIALDLHDGSAVWERTLNRTVPAVQRHPKSTHANPTVATDGKHVVALFGSEGLFVLDMEGELLWDKDLGVLDAGFYMVPDAQWGYSSSPVLFEDRVIVQADVQDGSFLAAFALEDGRELWRTTRADVPTFGTPTIYEGPDGPAIAVNGFRHIGGYDARTGAELWRLQGGGDIPTPTPVVSDGLIFITNAHGAQAPVYAVRTDARGDLTPAEGEDFGEHVAWAHTRGGSYMATPLVYGDELYVVRWNGVLAVYGVGSGEMLYEQRLGGGGAFTASPVAADGKIYIASEDGDVYVVAAGREYELLAVNSFGEPILATPAIAGGMLLFRTTERLVAVAAPLKRYRLLLQGQVR